MQSGKRNLIVSTLLTAMGWSIVCLIALPAGANNYVDNQSKYNDNGDGAVTDRMTGLMWQATEVRSQNWEQAFAYCRQLDLGGFSDWRLPSIKELSTLVDENRTDPAINSTFFPATRSAAYWTATAFDDHPGFAWYVHFDKGLEYNGGYKGRRYFVRAVRGGVISSVSPESNLIPPSAPKEKIQFVPDEKDTYQLQPYPLDFGTAYE